MVAGAAPCTVNREPGEARRLPSHPSHLTRYKRSDGRNRISPATWRSCSVHARRPPGASGSCCRACGIASHPPRCSSGSSSGCFATAEPGIRGARTGDRCVRIIFRHHPNPDLIKFSYPALRQGIAGRFFSFFVDEKHETRKNVRSHGNDLPTSRAGTVPRRALRTVSSADLDPLIIS